MAQYHALAINLHDNKPVIVKCKALYNLKANGDAVRIRVKHDKDFNKGQEYGRRLLVQNEEMLVRHVILSVNDDVEKLKEKFKEISGGDKRVAPKRISMGPVVEPLNAYKFPEDNKEIKKQKKNDKEAVIKSKRVAGTDIMQQYLKKKISCTDDAEVKVEQETEVQEPPESKSVAEGEGNHSQVTDDKTSMEVEVKENRTEGTDNGGNGGEPIQNDSEVKEIKGSQNEESELPNIKSNEREVSATDGVTDNHAREPENDDGCTNMNQSRSYGELNMYKSLYEESQKEVEFLRAELKKRDEGMQEDLKEMKELLSRNRDSSIARKSSISNLSKLPNNLVEGDEEKVASGKFKIGEEQYLTLQNLEVVQSARYFTARVERLCDLFCGGKSGEFSVDSKKGGKREIITPKQIDIMIRILLSISWSYKCRCDTKTVKARLIKHTSDCRNGGKKLPVKTASEKKEEKAKTTDSGKLENELKGKKKSVSSEKEQKKKSGRKAKQSDSSESSEEEQKKKSHKRKHKKPKRKHVSKESSDSEGSSEDLKVVRHKKQKRNLRQDSDSSEESGTDHSSSDRSLKV